MHPSPLPALLAAAVLAGPLAGQSPWTVRTDDNAPATAVKVARQTAGWQISSGPASILYRPTDNAKGNFGVTAKLHLLPGSGAHQEAFGLFIGGQDLAGAAQSYTYFLIRGDGTWKVKQRNGSATSEVTPGWQASAAIAKAGPRTPVLNVLRVVAGTDRVGFVVNGTEVWSGPRTTLQTDGIAGLRLNHNLSVRLEAFTIAP